MRSKKNEERLNEINRDFATSFMGQEYVSTGYTTHFHRNLEIYGVVDGSVTINIAGESKTLKNGQIAVVNRLESHSYEIAGEAKVIWVHIGTSYLRIFDSVYPNKRLARWLMNAGFEYLKPGETKVYVSRIRMEVSF